MRFITLAILSVALLLNPVKAVEVTELNPIEVLKVSSTLTKDPVAYNVTLPVNYHDKKDKQYVLLVDFHKRSQPLHAGMHDWMSHNGAWPWIETIIVTPTDYNPQFREIYSDYWEGKNQHLIDYIEKDLLAAITNKYRTNGFKIYSGFTGNAAVGLGLMLDKPDLFNAYILASPVLKEHPLNFPEKIEKQMTAFGEKPRYVMLSTSDSGYEQAQLEAFSAITDKLVNAAPKSLTVSIKRFDGTYYMTQPVLATSHAIEEIFDDAHKRLAPDSDIAKQGADAIIKHYKYLSDEKYGFEVSAQPSLKALGNALLEAEPKAAIAILQKAIEQYPDSAFAYDALAAAYFTLEQTDKAISTQKLAVKHSDKLVEFWQRKHQETLTKYQVSSTAEANAPE
ncbi:esterase [Thalassotalea euphylliae]|uniref:esterase n=1 Tax=Thalassotalea euphylliae TaxID=1655234 RepID=UPI003640E71B